MIHTFEQIRRIAIPSVRSCGVKNLYLLGFRTRGETLKTATSTCLSIEKACSQRLPDWRLVRRLERGL